MNGMPSTGSLFIGPLFGMSVFLYIALRTQLWYQNANRTHEISLM